MVGMAAYGPSFEQLFNNDAPYGAQHGWNNAIVLSKVYEFHHPLGSAGFNWLLLDSSRAYGMS